MSVVKPETWVKRVRLRHVALAVGAVVLLAFLPTVCFSLVGWDDTLYVTDNANLRGGLTPAFVRWAFSSCGYADNWHPLTWLSLALDVSVVRAVTSGIRWDQLLLAPSPLSAVMHAHNAVLHALNATLLFALLLRLLRTWRGDESASDRIGWLVCAFSALLWALHPLRTEVVCWVTERKELLSVFFMLLSMLAYVKGREPSPPHFSTSTSFLHLASLFFFALALLAKPVAVTLPALICAESWILRRESLRRSVLRTLPYGVLSLVCCGLTLQAQQEAMPRAVFTLALRVLTALKAPVVYLAQTLCPIRLSLCYATDAGWTLYLWAAFGLALLAAFAWVVREWFRTRRTSLAVGAFAVVWFYGGLVPMLGIVKVGSQPHSDRYTYWVGCALAVLLAWFLDRCRTRWAHLLTAEGERRTVRTAFAVLALVTVCTGVRSTVWRDSETLYRDAWEKTGDPMLADLLARVLQAKGRPQDADKVVADCVSEHPGPVSFVYCALYLLDKEPCSERDIQEAVYYVKRAEELFPGCPEVQQAYGELARVRGDWQEALRRYEKARGLGLNSLSLFRRIDLAKRQVAEK